MNKMDLQLVVNEVIRHLYVGNYFHHIDLLTYRINICPWFLFLF